MEILAQSSTAFVLTHNFQGTHILGASRGRLSDSVASCNLSINITFVPVPTFTTAVDNSSRLLYFFVAFCPFLERDATQSAVMPQNVDCLSVHLSVHL